MALDPSIIMGVNTQFQPFDPGAAMAQAQQIQAYKAQQIALQQQQAEMGRQNAIKSVLSDPDAVDDKGVFSTNALRQIRSIDPTAAQSLYQHNADMEYKQAQVAATSSEAVKRQQDALGTAMTDSMEAYTTARESGASEDAARKQAQDVWDDRVPTLKQLGAKPPNSFDPVGFSANAGYQTWKQDRDKTKFTENMDIAKFGEEQKKDATTAAHEAQQIGIEKARLSLEEQKQKEAEQGGLSDDAITIAANRVLGGDKAALQGLGRGTQGAADLRRIQNAVAAIGKSQGMNDQQVAKAISDASAGYQGEVSAAKSVSTLNAKIDTYANEAGNAAQMYTSAMKDLGNVSDFRPLNAAIQSGQASFSDPKLQRAALAANALALSYAKAMNPTGVPHKEDIEYARKQISTSLGKAGAQATADQILAEIRGAKRAARSTAQAIAGGDDIGLGGAQGSTSPQAPANPTGGWSLVSVK